MSLSKKAAIGRSWGVQEKGGEGARLKEKNVKMNRSNPPVLVPRAKKRKEITPAIPSKEDFKKTARREGNQNSSRSASREQS